MPRPIGSSNEAADDRLRIADHARRSPTTSSSRVRPRRSSPIQVTSRVSGYMTEVYFKDGDMVKEGDVLFRIDPRQYKAELERAEGNLQQIEAHKNRLEKEYHRAKILLGRGQISHEEHDRYESDFRESEASVKLAKSNRDLAQLNYDWCEVRASTSGRLSRRMVDPGNLVKADDTVLTSIVSLDPMYVYFVVNEQAMLKIQRLLEPGQGQGAVAQRGSGADQPLRRRRR